MGPVQPIKGNILPSGGQFGVVQLPRVDVALWQTCLATAANRSEYFGYSVLNVYNSIQGSLVTCYPWWPIWVLQHTGTQIRLSWGERKWGWGERLVKNAHNVLVFSICRGEDFSQEDSSSILREPPQSEAVHLSQQGKHTQTGLCKMGKPSFLIPAGKGL